MQIPTELVGNQIYEGHVECDAEGGEQIQTKIPVGILFDLGDIRLANLSPFGELALCQLPLAPNPDQIFGNVVPNALFHTLNPGGRRRRLCRYAPRGSGHIGYGSPHSFDNSIAYPACNWEYLSGTWPRLSTAESSDSLNFKFRRKIARPIKVLRGSSPTKRADFTYQTGGSVPTKRAESSYQTGGEPQRLFYQELAVACLLLNRAGFAGGCLV
jgi:hypothetical protein